MNDDIREHRNTERRHMIAVKNALAAGVAADAGGAEPSPEFLLACTDYLAYIIGRFQAQGRGNLEHLAPRVEAAGDEDGRRVVADIGATLARTGVELALLVDAADRWRGAPDGDASGFVAAGRRFVVFYDAMLASRKDPAQQIIGRYFDTDEYWALTNDVTADSIATERRLFAHVAELASPGIVVGKP